MREPPTWIDEEPMLSTRRAEPRFGSAKSKVKAAPNTEKDMGKRERSAKNNDGDDERPHPPPPYPKPSKKPTEPKKGKVVLTANGTEEASGGP